MKTLKWTKTTGGFRSECGRFEISRQIRRYGIEWVLTDKVCPVEAGVSGAKSTLSAAKEAAEWRLVNRPGKPLVEIL